MVRVRPPGLRIDHRLCVPVVRGDDPHSSARLQRLVNPRQSRVHCFHGFDRRFQLSRMPHHVCIRIIHDDGVELALLERFHDRVRNSRRGHFRLQIVSGHFRRRHQNALFSGERLLHPAIEKISHVCVLLRLRGPQILVLQLCKDLRQDVLQFFRRNHVLQPRPVLVILRHRRKKQMLRPLSIGKLIEVRRRKRVGHLPRAVRPEVVEDHCIVVVNQSDRCGRSSAPLGHYDRLDKFIPHFRFITPLERRNRIIRPRLRFAVNQCAISQLDAFPAVVAVHRVVAPHQRCCLAYSQLAHLLLQLTHVVAPAVRRRVASVHEAVHKHSFHFLLFRHLQ